MERTRHDMKGMSLTVWGHPETALVLETLISDSQLQSAFQYPISLTQVVGDRLLYVAGPQTVAPL